MDGFVDLVAAIMQDIGDQRIKLYTSKKLVTLPGFYRPSKEWDCIILKEGFLIAALELKSQIGPSFGNNFNNRVEEAVGNATDFWTACREGAFKTIQRPFLGYLMLLEDCNKSRMPVKATSEHFEIQPEFFHTSYAARYELLCRKLTQEELYSAACLLISSKTSEVNGEFTELSATTGLRYFVTGLYEALVDHANG